MPLGVEPKPGQPKPGYGLLRARQTTLCSTCSRHSVGTRVRKRAASQESQRAKGGPTAICSLVELGRRCLGPCTPGDSSRLQRPPGHPAGPAQAPAGPNGNFGNQCLCIVQPFLPGPWEPGPWPEPGCWNNPSPVRVGADLRDGQVPGMPRTMR